MGDRRDPSAPVEAGAARAGGGQGERIVAANVDQVIVMFAAAKPEPHPRMLDRFLVIAEGNDIPARIVINKVELVGEKRRGRGSTTTRARLSRALHERQDGRWPRVAARGAGRRRSVLTGPSGVGKSSLLNALFPGANLRVGEISESVNKGRHTTVGALMLPLPGSDGGYVVDTPGLREVGLWALVADQFDQCFPEIRGLSDQCRFADCRHVSEPDCAVRAALRDGAISPQRYDSYMKLLEEIQSGQ